MGAAWGRLRSWDLVDQKNELDKYRVLIDHGCASGSSVLGHTLSSEASHVRSSFEGVPIYDRPSVS